ncbi:general secretion pathway protein GspB [Photobacterium rosenbergii]|uniref:General secretion pathway protein GspB n=1 Tax=Photobacterium rosenbergii TaxID=294936 RepID=A0ABU3ZLP1_9GAMM|nr:general secretion pathway protein GspB [Photobacterium rosenbergii]MDV5171029.1 general secretion pathway protein GspB [Photobacterium rosenbergii]
MSKLLSALAQSDAQRVPAALPSGAAYRTGPAPKQTHPWLLTGAGFALPVIGMLGYLFFQQQQTEIAIAPLPHIADSQAAAIEAAASVQPMSAPTLEVAAVTDALQYPQGIERLDYPQFYTEPLPHQTGQSYRVTYTQTSSTPVQAGSEPSGWDSAPMPLSTSVDQSFGRPASNSADDSWDLEALDYSELSPQLASQLKAAIAATGDGETLPQLLQEERLPPMPEPQAPMSAVSIGDLPASVQDRIPSLNFQTHIYSSAANSRWVKVNGSEAYEGDEIAPGVTLRRIEPRAVVFDFESYLISMPALSEW